MSLTTVIFDLDGTLVQTREASWRLFQRTNREFNLGLESPDRFYSLFKDNFFQALDGLSSNDAERTRVRLHFQDLLRSDYNPELIPGMADVVKSLASRFTLVVLSSNTMESVRRILESNGLEQCFAHAFTGDVETSKVASIKRFLADPTYSTARRCRPVYQEGEAPLPQEGPDVVLVTDTVGDVAEALAAGIRAVGVVWGMHSRKELTAAGAEFVAIWPQEILAHLLAPGADPTAPCSLPGAPSSESCAVSATSLSTALPAARDAGALRRAARLVATGRLEDRIGTGGCQTAGSPKGDAQEAAGAASPATAWPSRTDRSPSPALTEAVDRICASWRLSPADRHTRIGLSG